ncbi:hypothetical protein OG539_39755 [Actinacidiphila glaucinigra]|uniref:hypothetical protein n=1 Tax=Actinacidiphila glaucinigra TaxID=235986 RepID=UPI00324A93A0
MADRLQLEWDVRDNGWADCRIADATTMATFSVSYCTDGLAALLSAVGGLYGASRLERFFFDSEPMEVRWVLRREAADVAVAIYEFPDVGTSPDLPDSEGRLAWTATQPLSELAHVVLTTAQQVLKVHGRDGYLTKWIRHPYPVSALQDLRGLHLHHDQCDLPHDMTLPPA